MRKLLFFTLLFFVGECLDANAASRTFLLQKCKEQMKENPPQVEIVYNFGNLEINRSKNYDEIADLYGKVYYTDKSPNYKISGLTVFNTYENIGVSVQYSDISTSHKCFIPGKVSIVVGFKDTVMYLASEMKEDTCLYNRVLRHEQMHVDVAHLSLELYAKALRARILEIIDDEGVVVSTDEPDIVAKKFSMDYKKRILFISKVFKGSMLQQQQRLDTPENYQKEQDICKR